MLKQGSVLRREYAREAAGRPGSEVGDLAGRSAPVKVNTPQFTRSYGAGPARWGNVGLPHGPHLAPISGSFDVGGCLPPVDPLITTSFACYGFQVLFCAVVASKRSRGRFIEGKEKMDAGRS